MVLNIGDNVLMNNSVWSVGSFSNALDGSELVDMINLYTQEVEQYPLDYINTLEIFGRDTLSYDEPPDSDKPPPKKPQYALKETFTSDSNVLLIIGILLLLLIEQPS